MATSRLCSWCGQVINFFVFRSLPTMPILVGAALIICGGAIITFWSAG